MRIILLGAPGSGKGTQADIISKRYGLKKISVGDILRDITKQSSSLSYSINKFLISGRLLPDKLVTKIVMQHISKIKEFLLDGFPRTLFQAQYIKENKIKINYVIDIKVPEDIILLRIIGRMIHEPSGRLYHKEFKPPKVFGKDDITGECLSIRKDDKTDILKNRISEYFKQSSCIQDFYLIENNKKNLIYKVINGYDEIENVSNEIFKIIENN